MDTEKLVFVMSRLGLYNTMDEVKWFFRYSYIYIEEPKESWYVSEKVRDFYTSGTIPDAVVSYATRVMADYPHLFYPKERR